MKHLLKLLKYLAVTFVSIIALVFLATGVFKVYAWRKHGTVMSISITRVFSGCDEGCNDFEVLSVDSAKFAWLKGKIVDIKQYSGEYKDYMPDAWHDQGYEVFCVSGKLHKAEDWYIFSPRGVYNFTGSAVHPGMCSNPKAKRFKG
jgi:hypothetical protein